MQMIHLNNNNFKVYTNRYTFSFSAESLKGNLISKFEEVNPVGFSFFPEINNRKFEEFSVAVKEVKEKSAAYRISGRENEVTLNLHFEEKYFSYYFIIQKSDSIHSFRYQEIVGDFFQVHNYDPDLHSYDIPYRIKTPLSISSRKKEFKNFFQIDEGNYMMPAYLTALYDKKQFFGIGLLDIPDAVHPFNAMIGVDNFSISFDYGDRKKGVGYQTPTIWFTVSNTRQEVLSVYSKAVKKKIGITNKPKQIEEWWLEPIYTTWGDQVYSKHIQNGNMHLESGSDQFLNSKLVDNALNYLKKKRINPKTIVLDEGWSYCLGYWDADDSKWEGSLKKYIADKHQAGYKIILAFNPFLVSKEKNIPDISDDFLIKDQSGELKTIRSSGQDYYLFDWSNNNLRSLLKQKIMSIFTQEGLNADGLKISATKLFPDYYDQYADLSYGVGEKFIEAVFQDIHSYVKEANDLAPIFLPCLNPLFQKYFDIVRLGNISEVNHDLYVSRAEIASYLMPSKPIDMDDWACYQKVIGVTSYLKTLCGIPNLYSSTHRGDGRNFYMGAMGGHPVETSDEQFNVLASAEALYQKSKSISRNELKIDFDSMTFQAGNVDTNIIRTYQGGNVLAVYNNRDIYFGSLLDGNVILEIPENFKIASISRILDDNNYESTDYQLIFKNKILIKAKSSRFSHTLYYHIEGDLNG